MRMFHLYLFSDEMKLVCVPKYLTSDVVKLFSSLISNGVITPRNF